ncbi:hypothetical protein [Streptomyces platensis]|uniref:hypothetical protein n=1 Tax=Streptomyces platensis TaxID=58346 RepID=UPI0037A4D16A
MDEVGHLMATDLRATKPTAPEGYSATVETHDGVTYVQLRAERLELAVQRMTGHQAAVGLVRSWLR